MTIWLLINTNELSITNWANLVEISNKNACSCLKLRFPCVWIFSDRRWIPSENENSKIAYFINTIRLIGSPEMGTRDMVWFQYFISRDIRCENYCTLIRILKIKLQLQIRYLWFNPLKDTGFQGVPSHWSLCFRVYRL